MLMGNISGRDLHPITIPELLVLAFFLRTCVLLNTRLDKQTISKNILENSLLL